MHRSGRACLSSGCVLTSLKNEGADTPGSEREGDALLEAILKVFFFLYAGQTWIDVKLSYQRIYLSALKFIAFLTPPSPTPFIFLSTSFVVRSSRRSVNAVLTFPIEANRTALWPEGECTACTFNGRHSVPQLKK